MTSRGLFAAGIANRWHAATRRPRSLATLGMTSRELFAAGIRQSLARGHPPTQVPRYARDDIAGVVRSGNRQSLARGHPPTQVPRYARDDIAGVVRSGNSPIAGT